LREQVNDLNVDVLVLDNIAQIFGGNGNDQHHVTVFVNAVRGLVSGRPFAPIVNGHVARSAGSEFSGSAAWENACRMRWYLGAKLPDQKLDDDEPVDPDTVYLARRKANYTSKDWRRLRFCNGLFIPEETEGHRFDQAYRDDAAERVVLSAFPRLVAMGIVPSDKPQAADYLPKQMVGKGYAQNHTKQELIAAMNRLMGTGRLRRDENAGKNSSRHPKPGLVMT
jgi:RecA-family ATPase